MSASNQPSLIAFPRFIATLFAFFLIAATGALGQEDEKEPYRPAREIQLLRSYFTEQYLSLHHPDPNHAPNKEFMSSFIDKRIDHFVEDLQEKTDGISRLLEAVTETSSSLLEPAATSESPSRLNRLGKQLKELEGELGRLHKTLAFILVGLKSSTRYKPQIDTNPDNRGFQLEVDYLRTEVDLALARIQDYFFKPRNIVGIDDLQHQNMLIHLKRAQRMAKALRKKVGG